MRAMLVDARALTACSRAIGSSKSGEPFTGGSGAHPLPAADAVGSSGWTDGGVS